MVITSWALIRDVVARRQIYGMLVAFIGALVIITRGDLASLAELRINTGDLWILAAIWFWTLYSIWLKPLPKEIGTRSLLLAITMIGLVILAPAHAIEAMVDRPMPLTSASVISVLYVGAGPSVLAFFCWNTAVARVGANMAGFFFFLMPVLGTIFAVIFLGERLFSYHFTGIVVVIAGIYFITSRRRRAAG
jgi:drug/metabolite transporter (DMT)-like permease